MAIGLACFGLVAWGCGDESTNGTMMVGGVAGERVFFVTSDTFSGGFGGPSAADGICQTRATQAGLVGRYRAWLPSTGTTAAEKIADARYVRPDGIVVARSRADLLDGSIENPLNRDEDGNQVGGDVWTGTLSTGEQAAATCELWTVGDNTAAGLCGSTVRVDARWTENIVPACGTQLRLFCFEI